MVNKKSHNNAKKISNKKARHDYELDDSFLVGIVLTGAETKALRLGHGQLRGAYVVFKDNELFLVNATITGGVGLPIPEAEQTRSRKLLAKRREIDALSHIKHSGRTILPLEVLTGGRYIKVRIAAGRGKKLYDKRQNLKQKDQQRSMNAALKYKQR